MSKRTIVQINCDFCGNEIGDPKEGKRRTAGVLSASMKNDYLGQTQGVISATLEGSVHGIVQRTDICEQCAADALRIMVKDIEQREKQDRAEHKAAK